MVAPTDDVQPPETGSTATGELTLDERAELERLRAEVSTLRQRPPRDRRRIWRASLATLLIVLGSLFAPLAVAAAWLDSVVTDTDRYVGTVAPLARDPAIQRAVTDRITTEVFSRIDIEALTAQVTDVLARQGLPEQVSTALNGLSQPIANGLKGWVNDQIGQFVASDEFARAWEEANRAAHAQLVAALTGANTGALVIEGDTVSVKLAPFITAVKERLIARGFTLAERIPAVDAQLTIFKSADVGKAQRWFRLLDGLGTWLPVFALVLLVGGVLAAPRKRGAVVGAAAGVALGMLLLGIGLAIARPLYLRAIPPDVLPSDAASVIFDQIVAYLRIALRTVLAVALIVMAVAYLSGPSTAAVATRRALNRGVAGIRGGAGRLGLRTGPVGVWVRRYKRSLRVATVVAAAAVFVFWDYPTPAVAGAIALVALLILALIELVGGPTEPQFRT
jgi:hypothetical protein